MGLHILDTNIIILNSRLDKYPQLKKIVYEHEYKHFEEKTVRKAIIRDYADAYKIYSHPEFFDFYKDTQKLTNQNILALKLIFYKAITFPMIFIQTFVMIREGIRRWVR